MDQLEIDRPFGVECLRAAIDLRMGEGWAWSIKEFHGGRSSVIDSGLAPSWQRASLDIVDALLVLVDPGAGRF